MDDCLSCQRPGPGRPDVVGEILAWARDPADLPWHAPGSGLVLGVPVANRGVSASASVVLRLLSPSRDRVLAEATLPNATVPRRDSVVKWALHLPQDWSSRPWRAPRHAWSSADRSVPRSPHPISTR